MQVFKLKYISKGLLSVSFSLILFYTEAQSVNQNVHEDLQVKGTVFSAATGKPLRAIRVTYQDYSASITDSSGSFDLKVPNYNVSVLFQGEGFQSKTIALKGKKTITASMYEDTYNSSYNVAYLPFEERPNNQIPFAASSTQTAGNWNHPSESPDGFLQGRVAGLNAVRRSGTPNVGANLYLRGISSLYASNQPLIVVDNVIYDITDYGGSIISNNYANPLAYIDVKDIDNITVIKDGSSIYGTKGANGVILITTLRAKELATRIDFGVYGGVNLSPKNLPVLSASDFKLYLFDLFKSAGRTESQIRSYSFNNDDPNGINYYRYHNQTNWQDQVFNNSSLKNYYLKVTGGDNIARYALSIGFLSNAGIIKRTDMSRYNARLNADLNLSKRLTATTNLSFTYNNQNLKDQGLAYKTNPIYSALIKSPFIGVNEFSNLGVASPTLTDADTFNVSNPVALINNMVGLNKNYRFFGSVNFNYLFSKSISLSSLVSITVDKVRESLFIPRKGVVNDTLPDGTISDSRLGSQTKRIISLYNDTRLSYNRLFGKIHHISAHAGFRFMQTKTEQDIILGSNSGTDQLQSIGNGLASANRTGGDLAEYKWLNTYINSDYSLLDKYFISLNAAIDGSSRFGKNVPGALKIGGNSFAVLPSIAAAWLISSEKFMSSSKLFDLIKLRASYGLSGNDDIGDYNEQQYFISQNFLGTQGLVVRNFGNDQLQWESVQKLNLGIDAALLNERINLTVDAYQNNTNKMLTYSPAPPGSGIKYALTNSGEMKTTGIEASIRGRIINKTSLKWDLGITIAHYKSILNKIPDNQFITNYAGSAILSRVGLAPNVFYGYKTNGIYSSDAEAYADGLSIMQANGTILPFKGGDVRFSDLNGDKIIDDQDRQVIGDPNPRYYGSINSSITWKRFSLEGLITFSQGNDIYNYTRRQLESESNFNNQTTAILNRWTNNGQVTNIPRPSLGDPMGNSRFSDRWIEKGSYLRLRTATLSYNIPVKTGFLRYSVIYLTGDNLFSLNKYLGYDPEMSSTDSVLGQGIDLTLEPTHVSVQAGIKIGL